MWFIYSLAASVGFGALCYLWWRCIEEYNKS